jgi:hypothetical protein
VIVAATRRVSSILLRPCFDPIANGSPPAEPQVEAAARVSESGHMFHVRDQHPRRRGESFTAVATVRSTSFLARP